MTKKKKKNKDYYAIMKKRKKGHRNFIFASVILLIPGVLALIGFNVLLLFSTTNFFLAFLVEVLDQYLFIINFGLIYFVGFISLLLVLEVRSFKSSNKKMRGAHNAGILKKNAIIQFLTDNKGNAFTSAMLVERIDYEGLSEEIESILSDLLDGNRINRVVKDNTLYYSI